MAHNVEWLQVVKQDRTDKYIELLVWSQIVSHIVVDCMQRDDHKC